tara:strand:+ start:52049 stop:52357 length:309 start_codon:yes stop_codon:yes gene_type:complete
MSDILDNYISKIDRGGISKKINYYILKLKHKKDGFIKSFTFKFEIIKIEFQLKIQYFKLGKFVHKNYDKENVVDFSYKDDFFLLNQDINKKRRYIKKLKNNV